MTKSSVFEPSRRLAKVCRAQWKESGLCSPACLAQMRKSLLMVLLLIRLNIEGRMMLPESY